MGQKKYVKLNPKACIFFDNASGIKVVRNEIVELTEAQFKLRNIRAALSNGYLKEVSEEEAKPKKVEEKIKEKVEEKIKEKAEESKVNVEELKAKWDELVADGSDQEKLNESFTLKELKALAISMDIEPEDNDTKMDLVVAMLEDQSESEE